MMEQARISVDQFNTFLRTLTIFKDICTDVDIKNGYIRQRTNDKFSVFQVNLEPILGQMNLPITNLKQKLELFKVFSNNEVEITSHDTYYIISDQYSSIRFENPDLEFLDNKFMTDTELSTIFTTNQDDVILSTEFSEFTSIRMKVVTGVFNVNTVQIIFNGNTADVSARTQAKDQYAKIISDIVTEKIIRCSTDIINTPFIIDHDGSIKLVMFAVQNGDSEIASNMFSTKINDIDINVYTRSNLVPEESVE